MTKEEFMGWMWCRGLPYSQVPYFVPHLLELQGQVPTEAEYMEYSKVAEKEMEDYFDSLPRGGDYCEDYTWRKR